MCEEKANFDGEAQGSGGRFRVYFRIGAGAGARHHPENAERQKHQKQRFWLGGFYRGLGHGGYAVDLASIMIGKCGVSYVGRQSFLFLPQAPLVAFLDA